MTPFKIEISEALGSRCGAELWNWALWYDDVLLHLALTPCSTPEEALSAAQAVCGGW